jgi:hypothetical protein
MALFTDGPVSSIEDLTAQDSQLLNVANVEGIDVTQKLALAQDQLALELTTLLARMSFVHQVFWLAAPPSLGSVVVTPALKLWHTFRSLELVYADAFASQLNDRYAARRDQFHEQAKQACDQLAAAGIGIAWMPVPQAAAPRVVAAAGSLPDNTYYVTMSWTNSTNDEGAPAVTSSITTSQSTLLVQPVAPPANAAGWNVYAGTDLDGLELQNGSPIAVGQTWLQPNTVTTGGRGPGRGQSPSYLRPAPRIIQRG